MFEMFEEFCRAKAEQSRSKYLRKQTPGAAIYRARIEREEKIRQ